MANLMADLSPRGGGACVSGREKYLHRRISEMGLRDTWAIPGAR